MSIIENPDALLRFVQDDVTKFFATAIAPRDGVQDDGFDVPEAFREAPPTSANGAAAVPWRWRGQHVGTFGEIAPTGGVVDVSGVTLVLDDGSQLIRIVDWLTLYRQMGMMMVCRRPRHSHADDPQREETFDTTDIP